MPGDKNQARVVPVLGAICNVGSACAEVERLGEPESQLDLRELRHLENMSIEAFVRIGTAFVGPGERATVPFHWESPVAPNGTHGLNVVSKVE